MNKELEIRYKCKGCGNIYKDEIIDDYFECPCEDGFEFDLCFLDLKTNKLYSRNKLKKHLCKECNGCGYLDGGLDYFGDRIYVKCYICKGTGLKEVKK